MARRLLLSFGLLGGLLLALAGSAEATTTPTPSSTPRDVCVKIGPGGVPIVSNGPCATPTPSPTATPSSSPSSLPNLIKLAPAGTPTPSPSALPEPSLVPSPAFVILPSPPVTGDGSSERGFLFTIAWVLWVVVLLLGTAAYLLWLYRPRKKKD